MFTKMKNIDTAFRSMRLFTICVVVGSLVLNGFIAYQSYRFAFQMQQSIYILAGGKALEAFASGRNENIPVEARDHIAVFHTLFFTLEPDEKVIQPNITKSLYLADASAAKQYSNLKESGFYNNIIAGNISQQITIDSTQLNLDRYPYYFRCYCSERLVRPTTIVTRNLITEGYLRNVKRSDNNPHGFLIERWSILDNRDIQTQNR